MEYFIIKRVESNANDAAGRPKGKECGEGGRGPCLFSVSMQKSFVIKFQSMNVIVSGLSISNMSTIDKQLQREANEEHEKVEGKHTIFSYTL